jgi:hypothetical protein
MGILKKPDIFAKTEPTWWIPYPEQLLSPSRIYLQISQVR